MVVCQAMSEPPTTAVHLDTDEVDLVFKGETQRLPCVIVLETDPRPRLSLKVTMTSPWMAWALPQLPPIHIVHADITCEAFITHINGETIGLSPAREPIAVGRSQALTEVHFDLINFPSFCVLAGQSPRLPDDQLDIEAEGWQIEIRPTRKSSDLEAFRATLCSVDHSCTIRKSDNATFSSGSAQNLLDVIHDAMSFAAGQWVAPVFVHGFESDKQITWKEWGTRPLHPNLGRIETWFDTHHANTLAEILPGALELRKDAERTETFHSALYWYLRSTSTAAGVDGGTILLQAALERLSWQLFVGDRKALSGEGFKRLHADDQLRILIEGCGIPTGIPPGLSDITD